MQSAFNGLENRILCVHLSEKELIEIKYIKNASIKYKSCKRFFEKLIEIYKVNSYYLYYESINSKKLEVLLIK